MALVPCTRGCDSRACTITPTAAPLDDSGIVDLDAAEGAPPCIRGRRLARTHAWTVPTETPDHFRGLTVETKRGVAETCIASICRGSMRGLSFSSKSMLSSARIAARNASSTLGGSLVIAFR